MSIITLPKEIIIIILEQFKLNSLCNKRYDGWSLYATCRSFKWMEELEIVCIEDYEEEFDLYITSRKINGMLHGMQYAVNTLCNEVAIDGFCFNDNNIQVGCYVDTLQSPDGDSRGTMKDINGKLYEECPLIDECLKSISDIVLSSAGSDPVISKIVLGVKEKSSYVYNNHSNVLCIRHHRESYFHGLLAIFSSKIEELKTKLDS